jgi:hypothetical protein
MVMMMRSMIIGSGLFVFVVMGLPWKNGKVNAQMNFNLISVFMPMPMDIGINLSQD